MLMVAEKPINKEALRITMSLVWKLQGRADFKEVRLNMFMVKFHKLSDLQRVQEGRPWTFDKYLFCFSNYDGLLTPQHIEFNREPMWVQLHDLPLGMMKKLYGEKLGKSIGKVIEVGVDEDEVG